LLVGGRALTRALKPVPNKFIREYLEGDDGAGARAELAWDGLDGELMLPAPYTFQDIDSMVMSKDEPPPDEWYFGVFDRMPDPSTTSPGLVGRQCAVNKSSPAAERLGSLWENPTGSPRVRIVEHEIIRTIRELLEFEELCLSNGYEGVMLRAPGSPYKHGRSTVNEGWLLKLKRWEDSEALVIGFVPRFHNTNEAKVSELGLTKRSSAKAGKVKTESLGALVVKDLRTGIKFEVGTGFSETQRVQFWRERDSLAGRICKYKHFAVSGVKEKPRHPVWLGWRSAEDMSDD
jgi:DNA ligase-1